MDMILFAVVIGLAITASLVTYRLYKDTHGRVQDIDQDKLNEIVMQVYRAASQALHELDSSSLASTTPNKEYLVTLQNQVVTLKRKFKLQSDLTETETTARKELLTRLDGVVASLSHYFEDPTANNIFQEVELRYRIIELEDRFSAIIYDLSESLGEHNSSKEITDSV